MCAAQKKSSQKVHTANLLGNKAHGGKDNPDLGCVFRCGRHGQSHEHRHRENAYAYTKANYASYYNIDFKSPGDARDRFDRVFGKFIFRGQKGWDPRYKKETWFIGDAKPNNYHKGLHPFSNQHHHILPIGAFHDNFDHQELILLMLAGYNINCGENMIILPVARPVGKVMEMLTHPNNHNDYCDQVQEKIQQIKYTLSEAADDEVKGHPPVEEDQIPNLKDELMQWSTDQWGSLFIEGKENPGGEVNEVDLSKNPV